MTSTRKKNPRAAAPDTPSTPASASARPRRRPSGETSAGPDATAAAVRVDLLRLPEDSGWIALDLRDEPTLVYEIAELRNEGEADEAVRLRLAAAPLALCGSGFAESEAGEHSAFIAIDPVSGDGVLEVDYADHESQRKPVRGLENMRAPLRDALLGAAHDLVELVGCSSKIKITLRVPRGPHRLRKRSARKRHR